MIKVSSFKDNEQMVEILIRYCSVPDFIPKTIC